jgi:hypothetical protein
MHLGDSDTSSICVFFLSYRPNRKSDDDADRKQDDELFLGLLSRYRCVYLFPFLPLVACVVGLHGSKQGWPSSTFIVLICFPY